MDTHIHARARTHTHIHYIRYSPHMWDPTQSARVRAERMPPAEQREHVGVDSRVGVKHACEGPKQTRPLALRGANSSFEAPAPSAETSNLTGT